MKSTRRAWLFWIAAVTLWFAVAAHPLSVRATRAGGLVLLGMIWVGLAGLGWQRRPLRFTWLALTIFCAGFLAAPARNLPDSSTLRADYLRSLRRYEGVPYYWGGESFKGIDCSGLIRRGLIDSLFLRGIWTADAGLVRRSLWLWWNDCTAQALGEGRPGLTVHLLDAPSLNAFDHSRLLPGDLAVTSHGVHILAYLGDERWIEADPEAGRVLTLTAPSEENSWFRTPMHIVRWRLFQPAR